MSAAMACRICRAKGVKRAVVAAEDPDPEMTFYRHVRKEHSLWETFLWYTGLRS